jgi:alpha 1,3-mannosyltransferase
MNFTPARSYNPKEGRSHHGGLLHAGPMRRGNRRVVGLVAVGLIVLGFFFFGGTSFTSNTPSTYIPGNGARNQVPIKDPPRNPAAADEKTTPYKAPAQEVYVHDEERTGPYGNTAKPGGAKGYGSSSPGSSIKDVAPDEEPATKGSRSKPIAISGGKVKWSERPLFEKALAKVINMLPGEMHMRDLLRPVEGTGKERIREMGLRTRAYKSYFEAWEDLHLDTDDEGGTYVRDDVVQYLRSHVHGETIAGLENLDLAQQIRTYESYRYFLAKFGQMLFPWTAPYFSDHMSLHAHFKRGGRGIVLTAGDDQAPYLLTSIPILRELGCKLPVEVMYLGDSDLSEDFRSDLEAMDGVVTRDIAQMVNDEGWRLAGWAAKPFAVLFSSFREVIFIDADSLFFKNPEVMFDDPGYKKTGALFFKDRMIMPENKKRLLQQLLPKPISKQVKQSRFWLGESGHMQESGVLVIDKWKHFIAMLMVTRMNGPDRDGNKDEGRIGVYDLVYGKFLLCQRVVLALFSGLNNQS